MSQQFTWLPFFDEMLSILCRSYDKESLAKLFHEIFKEAGGREDNFKDGTRGPLREIDPLTFIAFFNRNNTDFNRIAFCKRGKSELKIQTPVPEDFSGIPYINAQKTWFFSWEKNRSESDLLKLWQFSRALNESKIDEDLFKAVLNIANVGLAKLTSVMFICKPREYISFDKTNEEYFKVKGFYSLLSPRKEVESSPRPFARYQSLLAELVKHFSDKSFYEISNDAYMYSKNSPKETQVKTEPARTDNPENVKTLINMTARVPQNIIFYGPPGTGKTYKVYEYAVKLAEPEFAFSNRSELMMKYRDLRAKGKIEFITFHQSYSYEEFIEGLRPEAEEGQIEYEIQPDVLKRLVNNIELEQTNPAKNASIDFDSVNVFKMSLGNASKPEDEEIFDFCMDENCIGFGYGGDVDFSAVTNIEDRNKAREIIRELVVKRYPDTDRESFTVTAVFMFINQMLNGDLVIVSQILI